MDLNIVSRQSGGYTVNTPVFEGPLDLLLQLIERALCYRDRSPGS